ncbi:hypothetical protein SAMN05444377_11553 [Flavobacterium fontis]|uniref:Uncharacterized protein n=1 Tax=Flavobacterium fontis TaxID=1124188 RepID=A0A1M5DJN4_9FLAO|nr:hypothetical protein [Flavobacterium fontis]SHF67193.1 hypothetical protein SAMN05444377_11553 [Flavobacterium fontis]
MSSLHAIPKSCAENWLDLNPTEKARFCTLCHQNIFDDQHVTEEEAQAFIAQCKRNQTRETPQNFWSKIKRKLKKR